MRPLTSRNAPGFGVSELADPTSDVAYVRDTTITVADDQVVEEVRNAGVVVRQHLGDGRMRVPVLVTPPTNPQQGDVWLEDTGGITLRFHDGTTTQELQGSVISTSSQECVASAALVGAQAGSVIRVTEVGGNAQGDFADAAAGSPLAQGILAQDVTAVGVVPFKTDGQMLTLSAAEVLYLTGAASLEVGRTYYLSRTPGRWTADPFDTANAGANPVTALVSVCRVLEPLLVQVDLSTRLDLS